MAGHSKWKNIQHRKGAQDAKKGKVFTKIAMEITVAAKLGGADLSTNARLRQALVKARYANMPKDNVDRAIKKGTGGLEGVVYQEKVYEGYGPGGVAFVVECLTDNVNRTVGDVRPAFNRVGGNLGTEGSVGWMFHKKGVIAVSRAKVKDPDRLYEVAIDKGAEDVTEEEDGFQMTCAVESFNELREAIEGLGLEPDIAEITRIPENTCKVPPEQQEKITRLVDALEDNDDVQNVYHNAEFEN